MGEGQDKTSMMNMICEQPHRFILHSWQLPPQLTLDSPPGTEAAKTGKAAVTSKAMKKDNTNRNDKDKGKDEVKDKDKRNVKKRNVKHKDKRNAKDN